MPGCIAVQSSSSATHPRFSVLYDVEPMLIGLRGGDDELKGMFQQDFQEARRLGFGAVIGIEVDAKVSPDLKAAADAAHVTLLISDSDRKRLVNSRAAIDDLWKDRAKPAIVRPGRRVVESPTVAVSLLSQYHSELVRGRTGGMVIERFRSLPNDGPDVAGADPKTAAEFARLVERFHRWDPILCDAAIAGVESASGQSDAKIASMKREGRCFALIVNQSTERSVHGEISVGSQQAAVGDVESAVEVPTSSEASVGRVFRGHGGIVAVRVDLPPGDAMLVELF
ncbi:MAG: hypothetical protein HY287_03070 [Planctomycetes bacterium]|nr:hypothetical protein [Planctomycetota bacterium]